MTRYALQLAVLLLLYLPELVMGEAFTPVTATKEHINLLHQGGFVLFIRHGATDTSRPDQVPIDIADCDTQRPLSDAGREEMAVIAEAMRSLEIPISDVFSSPLCRAVETSQILFGDDFEINPLLMYVAALTDDEKAPILRETDRLLSLPVTAGQNRVLVAHGPNMAELMEYFPPEGTVVIFSPLADRKYEYIASITPRDWPGLLHQSVE
ncbi:histidine phosphatase family protein [Nitrincola alkalilacustris]|uniref:histidine phosphatase family protein n=1 Tax=Nitrincola alkalilacustris TaxID=1571224 RepID=UPI00124E2717|nr:histidine phosphatase family protein [Nitrincola alkalilacustris]